MYTKTCKVCGKQFISQGTSAFYCPVCREERRKEQIKMIHQRFKLKTHPPKTFVCHKCGIEFTSTHYKAAFCPDCNEKLKKMSKAERFTEWRQRTMTQCNDRLELIKERWAVLQEQKTIHKIAMGE